MKKRLMLALMLILCAVLLASCGETKRYDVLTTNNSGTQQSTGTVGDPLAEEDDWEAPALPTQVAVTPTPAPTVRSEYAGATPVVIDPIDKPTPTPVPALSVAYTTYDAIKLGLSFEGPAGWLKDDSAADTFVIQNPNARIDYPATLTLRAEKVASDYTTSDLKTVVSSMLTAIGGAGFDEYDRSSTDTRSLLGKTGVYANYTGTLNDGRQVAGRVHAVCVDKVLYTIHITAPKAQWNDYKEKVYDHLKDTLTITK
jgi:hypothetical protein